MNWTDGITLAIALLGATLGLINTWNSISDRRVRIRVRPLWTHAANGQGFAIEVTNLSAFPVTIAETGLLYERPRSSSPERAVLPHGMRSGDGKWPRRLEPRDQVTVYSSLSEIPTGRSLWGGYARTMCGELAHGRSPALRQLSDILQRSGGAQRRSTTDGF
jgi:hypothetical protein